jgi:predicted O-methyltransferase YrrM
MTNALALQSSLSVLSDPRLTEVLVPLHLEARRDERRLVARLLGQLPKVLFKRRLDWTLLSPRLTDLYLAVDPANGLLCYQLLRALRARCVVELGTSMGVSTIYLAAAVRDNGGGRVITTEIVPAKAEQARLNLARAGLLDLVDFRVGDALQTLADPCGAIDFVLNDVHPPAALPIMQRLAPHLRPGAVALCGNAALFPADYEEYLCWVREPSNGFSSLQLPMRYAGEFSVKTGSGPTSVTVNS